MSYHKSISPPLIANSFQTSWRHTNIIYNKTPSHHHNIWLMFNHNPAFNIYIFFSFIQIHPSWHSTGTANPVSYAQRQNNRRTIGGARSPFRGSTTYRPKSLGVRRNDLFTIGTWYRWAARLQSDQVSGYTYIYRQW